MELPAAQSAPSGLSAEAYLAAFEFDLGRYADILLNVFLGILIFYFPGGHLGRRQRECGRLHPHDHVPIHSP